MSPTILTVKVIAGADLAGTDLRGLDLSGLDLIGIDFTNADLTGADLTGVSSGGITGTPAALPAGWQLTNGYLIGPGADLAGANLAGQDLSGSNLAGADLRGADLTGVSSGGITGPPAALPAGWQLTNGYLIGPGANLAGADLAGLDLRGADLTGVSSGGITGTPAALPAGWQLTAGYLIGPGANLAGADLAGLDLSGADFSGATLSGTDFSGATLTGANLSSADLTGADLTGVSSGGITGTPASLPAGWQLTNGYLGQGELVLGYRGAMLYASGDGDLLGLHGATFLWQGRFDENATPFSSNGVDFDRFSGSHITVTISGSVSHDGTHSAVDNTIAEMNDSGNDLLHLGNAGRFILSGIHLYPPALFVPPNFTGAVSPTNTLTPVNTADVISFGDWLALTDPPPPFGSFASYSVMSPTILTVKVIAGADLAGTDLRGLDLSGFDLSGIDFTNADLTGADLGSADLTGADLTGVSSGGITGMPAALPAGWQLIAGYLIGPGANLAGADLAGLDLSGTDLAGATLTGANLSSADLTGADLSGATLSGTDFSGATLTGANLTGAISVVDTLADESDVPAGATHSLREGIRDVPPGVTILFDPALSGGTLTLGGTQLLIDKDLAIDASALAGGVTIDATGNSRVIDIPAGGHALTLDSLTLRGGNVAGNGGGIRNSGGTLWITDSILTSNSVTIDGGALYTSGGGAIAITDSTLSDNDAGGDGGGIFNSGSGSQLAMSGCTVSGNSANDKGGGVLSSSQANMAITNSSFSGNMAGTQGGALWGGSNAVLTLRNSTVSGNSANSGGGLYFTSGSANLENTIVAGNAEPGSNDDIRKETATLTSTGGNLIGINNPVAVEFPVGSPNGNGDFVGTEAGPLDPLLAALGDFAGPTQTMPPLPGSPAIEGAVMLAGTPATDQRGAPRPAGPLPDIGAVEAFPFASLPLIDTDNDGIDDRLEAAYPQFTVGVDDSALDTDGDGSPDAEELANMTDPDDGADVFRVFAFGPAPGFDPATNPVFSVILTTFPGLAYEFETGGTLDSMNPVPASAFTAETFTVSGEILFAPGEFGFVRGTRN